jgi:TonB family protein
MSLRALVYSKMPLTATALAPVFKGLNIEAEVCNDAFAAIEKGTKQAFSCVIVDWADQPEASFLLRRARESALNPNVVAIAIVDREPAPVEIREHRLDFLLYRPITVGEAAAVLAKACQGMHVVSAPILETEPEPELRGPLESFEGDKEAPKPADPNLVSVTAPVSEPVEPRPASGEIPEHVFTTFGSVDDDGPNFESLAPAPSERSFTSQHAFAIGLAAAAIFCLWLARDSFQYLSHAPEGATQVLKDSAAAALFSDDSPPRIDAQEDAYFARRGEKHGRQPRLGVVTTAAKVPEGAVPRAFDFPLPTPGYDPPKPPPVHVRTVQVPESLKGAGPIGPPVIATGPAQVVPVTAPLPPFTQFHEPVFLTEDTARGMLVHRVDPTYPHEAAAQKLQGPVVLEATIGRDGRVEDLKIVRGYFVLSRAAIAAVKQWRFQPYMINGRAAQMQTTITINFNR